MWIKKSIYLIFTLSLLTNVYGRRSLFEQTKHSILFSFKQYIQKRLKKTDPGPGIICTRPGTKPNSLVCYNTGGEQNCVARKEQYNKLESQTKGRSLYRRGRRTYYNPYGNMNIDQVKKSLLHVPAECPSPCGCWLVCLLSQLNLFLIFKDILSYFFL